MVKHTVNKDLKHIGHLKQSSRDVTKAYAPFGIASLFLLCTFYGVSIFTGDVPANTVMMVAAVLGGYMALNIGANDVANNVSPAVGSKALTMTGALILAAVFEAAGAMIAGGSVVSTISKGIIDPNAVEDATTFVRIMMSALLAAALWLNLATWIGAPVSTTHSIVGGVMGAGIASAGLAIVAWGTMGQIAASWVISPILGGAIAAMLFALIKKVVLGRGDMLQAAQYWVPILLGIMISAFGMYLMLKGFKRIWKPDMPTIWLTGLTLVICVPVIMRPIINKATQKLENSSQGVNKLFTMPLIFSAALLSFAHGSNDVANAVGPLAAIVSTAAEGNIAAQVSIPIWVMFIGAFGISLGLMLFGPKIIRTVGQNITKLDQMRAFCIVLAAAMTVIAASTLGLPVSSTHITVGGVFGVGLFREFTSHSRRKKTAKLPEDKLNRRKLVRRSHLLSIAAAWVVTVPCAAALSAAIYGILHYANMMSMAQQ
jgi:PiT family inorganic phosphate transporter